MVFTAQFVNIRRVRQTLLGEKTGHTDTTESITRILKTVLLNTERSYDVVRSDSPATTEQQKYLSLSLYLPIYLPPSLSLFLCDTIQSKEGMVILIFYLMKSTSFCSMKASYKVRRSKQPMG
jgi:hypothetical protein